MKKGKLIIDENGNITAEKVMPKAESKDLTLKDKIVLKIEGALEKIYKLRCICCHTSLLALIGLVFPFASSLDVSDIAAYVLAILWLAGVVSGLIACPLQLLGTSAALVAGGVGIGLIFLVVGAVIGLVISLLISGLLIFIFPAVITLKYYHNELNPKSKYVA